MSPTAIEPDDTSTEAHTGSLPGPVVCEDDPFEPNDLRADAVAATDASGSLVVCEGRPDWWAFDVPPGERLTAEFAFDGGLANLDVELVASDGVVLDRSYGVGDVETVRWYNANPNSATVVAEAALWLSGPSLDYVLAYDTTPCAADGNEPDDDVLSATPGPESLSGTVRFGDVDVVAYAVPPQSAVALSLVFDSAIGDLDLGLVDTDGALVVLATNSEPGTKTLLHYNPGDSEQVVWARVQEAGPASQSAGCLPYTLTSAVTMPICTEDADEPNDTVDDALPLDTGTSASVSLASPDVWLFEAGPGEVVQILPTWPSSEAGLRLEVRTEEGTLVSTGSHGVFPNPGSTPSTGSVLVQVDASGPGVCTTYTLDRSTAACLVGDASEDDDDPSSAAPFTADGAAWLAPGDEDWREIAVPSGATLTSSVSTPAVVDIDLELYDATRLLTASRTTDPIETLSWRNTTGQDTVVRQRVFYYV
jgi:hypothetical protein